MMRKNVVDVKHFILLIVLMTVGLTMASAQGPPIFPDGSKIEGAWNMEVQWVTCDDGTPQLFPSPELISFARGGVMTVLNSALWCDVGHCSSLGVWKHLGGRSYAGTYKRFRRSARAVADADPFFDDVDFLYQGFVIVGSNITHEANDTLIVNDRLRFYDSSGDYSGQDADRCRTAVGTRFTGEN